MASEKVAAAEGPCPTARSARQRAGSSAYHTAITAYSPNRQGAVRNTVRSVQPRVSSTFRYERISSNVVSMFQRAVYCSTTWDGVRAASVVKKYSGRCVPVRSST